MLYTIKGFDSIVKGKSFEPPKDRDFPKKSNKYADIYWLYENTTPYVQHILNAMPLTKRYANIVVDVKVHNLNKGDVPALPTWHIDGTPDVFDNKLDDVNHLFVSNISLTAFLEESHTVDLPSPYNPTLDNFCRHCSIKCIEPCTIYTYGRHPHRAMPAILNGTRLLIRATETNYIKPRNQFFNVTYRRDSE